jgi:hypothetical protein
MVHACMGREAADFPPLCTSAGLQLPQGADARSVEASGGAIWGAGWSWGGERSASGVATRPHALCPRALQVYLILDEFLCGGEIQETAKKVMSMHACPVSFFLCRGAPPHTASLSSSHALDAGHSGAARRAGQDRHIGFPFMRILHYFWDFRVSSKDTDSVLLRWPATP